MGDRTGFAFIIHSHIETSGLRRASGLVQSARLQTDGHLLAAAYVTARA